VEIMGLGDWIMATSQVRELNERTGKKVVVVDRLNRPRWSEAFENNPRILRSHEPDCTKLLNAGGARPYIRQKTTTHWIWQRWDITPGEIYLTEEERTLGSMYAGRTVVEPNTKDPYSNKAWVFDRWQELVNRFPPDTFIQLGSDGSRKLAGVPFVQTSIRQAFAVLSAARLFVGTEGAMHHAAAALGVPAVVLWSEFIGPKYTGYSSQTNIRKVEKVCGSRIPCQGCKAAMAAISVDEIHRIILEKV
jgi:hypothetical protein